MRTPAACGMAGDVCPATTPDATTSSNNATVGGVAVKDGDIAEIRMRFYNFNMANSPFLRSMGDLLGPSIGGGIFQVLSGPLRDGSEADVVFLSLPETQIDEDNIMATYHDVHPSLDRIICTSATKESMRAKSWGFGRFLENLAGDVNGDLKTCLAFHSHCFVEDPDAELFELFHDITVAGCAVPNPKKAYIGRSIKCGGHLRGLRLSFVGAHFPITDLSSVLDNTSLSPQVVLEEAKRLLAAALRNVLQGAVKKGCLDASTVLCLQGDLNSRTVLCGGGQAHDVLLEVLKDEALQRQMCEDVEGAIPGRWHEIHAAHSADSLPMTYKFQKGGAPRPSASSIVAASMGWASSEPSLSAASPLQQESENARPRLETDDALASGRRSVLTIGDIIGMAMKALSPSRSTDSASCMVTKSGTEHPIFASAAEEGIVADDLQCSYKDILEAAGEEMRSCWGIAFKPGSFRAFRFPACADRVIYWAPNSLAPHISWKVLNGGYDVNHRQEGSDHKPVCLEAVLRVAAPFLSSCPEGRAPAEARRGSMAARGEAPASEAEAASGAALPSPRSLQSWATVRSALSRTQEHAGDSTDNFPGVAGCTQSLVNIGETRELTDRP